MQAPKYDSVLGYYPVRDLSATRDFYVRDLGLRIARDEGTCLVLAAGSGTVGFCQTEEGEAAVAETSAAGPVITFVTDAVDALHDRLRRLGTELEGPPRHHPSAGVRHFFVRDPDGYRIEVRRYDDATT